MTTKILVETLKMADGGRVECQVQAPDGAVVHGVIEKEFFEDFMGVPNPQMSLQQRGRIVQDNLKYFEAEAERQWQMGLREVVIR